jgi:YjbR
MISIARLFCDKSVFNPSALHVPLRKVSSAPLSNSWHFSILPPSLSFFFPPSKTLATYAAPFSLFTIPNPRYTFPMNIRDFRRIALSFPSAEESSHMGNPDFRVGGRIFATLASAKQGYGNIKLTLEQQQAFVAELPDVFLPIPGGWGRMGMTHIILAAASEDVLTGALHTAYQLRVSQNAKSSTRSRPKSSSPQSPSPTKKPKRTSTARPRKKR